ncbi:hypothetical protein GCM10011369_36720 [Neiella marina]|uniref:Uncharacterized protein n=1 Tax=Neiella marina TaxID=508461 RepID=A0A8J2XS03_9GAMM|nr:hypothetical protein GCM10011369_36720 [Neiella marina]
MVGGFVDTRKTAGLGQEKTPAEGLVKLPVLTAGKKKLQQSWSF